MDQNIKDLQQKSDSLSVKKDQTWASEDENIKLVLMGLKNIVFP